MTFYQWWFLWTCFGLVLTYAALPYDDVESFGWRFSIVARLVSGLLVGIGVSGLTYGGWWVFSLLGAL